MRLKGKVAVVTGGSQGIGKAIVEAFLKEGANVISFDISGNDISNEKFRTIQGSVTNRDDVVTLCDILTNEYKSIDILVNNAGITRDGLIEFTTEEMWDMVVDVNLKGVFNVTQLAAALS